MDKFPTVQGWLDGILRWYDALPADIHHLLNIAYVLGGGFLVFCYVCALIGRWRLAQIASRPRDFCAVTPKLEKVVTPDGEARVGLVQVDMNTGLFERHGLILKRAAEKARAELKVKFRLTELDVIKLRPSGWTTEGSRAHVPFHYEIVNRENRQ